MELHVMGGISFTEVIAIKGENPEMRILQWAQHTLRNPIHLMKTTDICRQEKEGGRTGEKRREGGKEERVGLREKEKGNETDDSDERQTESICHVMEKINK